MNNFKLASVSALSACLMACSNSDEAINNDRASTDVNLRFVAEVNDQAFSCGATYSGVGTGVNNSYQISDFRFYVHDLKLRRADGSTADVALEQDGMWQLDNVALLDFETGCSNGNADTNTAVHGTVDGALADYNGLCFTLGVPFDKNHLDDATAQPPLNLSSMLWAWTSGRKFLRIDGAGDPANLNVPFHIHLGSTGCVNASGDPQPDSACAQPNTVQVCLDMDVASQQVSVDPGRVLADSDITVATPNTPAGCMSANRDPECIEVMTRLGLDFIHDDGSNPAQTYPAQAQQLFAVDQ